MSTSGDQIRALAADLLERADEFHAGVVAEMEKSVVDGHELTGAPGQPVDDGDLKESWETTHDGPSKSTTESDSPYAQAVEDNWGNVTYKNGGSHSLKLTVAGAQTVADVVAERVRLAHEARSR